ncbi:restriction endonuclease [Bifidobacterium oedipodis]|uniref:Restriction endonuclease n=1 Tax=Bifidobacterium oedipodis TaxID=2675322 RepID=A0A7Y0HQP0_9BIFI|nr:restriction endonuclease [Bifidobacterium sp. DSM 109957]NMM93120.1 restriction endonuclease [Bifidobacterium sp. DSM 109957]
MNELMNAADGKHASETATTTSDGTDTTTNATDATDDAEILHTTVDESIEKIKDRITLLSWDEMELLAAGLLRAMGYRTSMTPKGGDQGRDVIASPDGLGLSSPRIIVEVKHRKEKMGAPALRSFIGRLHDADKGLYISTGGFTKEAVYEAERARVPVTLLDLDRFVRVLVDNYETTDPATQALLPLTRIYWPT